MSSSSDGFGDFAAFSAAPPAPVVAPAQSFDPFGSSSQVPALDAPAFAAPTPAPVQPVSFDPFGSTTPISYTQPTSAPTSSSFGQFGAAPAASAPAPAKNFSAFDALSAPNLAYGQPQGVAGMHNGMGMARGPSGMGGYQQQQQYYGMPQQQQQYQQPQMMGGAGYGGNPAMSISTFMDPHASNNQNRANGAVYGRPGGQPASRDPFAGLGLPQH